jgi:hypothetical protein
VISSGELNRVFNALATTMSDQRWPTLDVARAQGVVDGTLGSPGKLTVTPSGELVSDGETVGRVERRGERWIAAPPA